MNFPLRITLYTFLFVCLAAGSSVFADRAIRVSKKTPKVTSIRTALVIGNSKYQAGPLKNPANDAKDIKSVLEKSSFKVTLLLDANRKEMGMAITEFGSKLRKTGGTGLFYYAGHGVQVDGFNYLIPIGSEIFTEAEVPYEAINANRVLSQMQEAGNALNMVFLDACRNNPYAKSFRSGQQGLAPMDAPMGSLVSYATAAGSVASDGEERNGVYTKHLLQHIQQPNLELTRMMKLVRIGVQKDTGGKQMPYEMSALVGDFYFTTDAPDDENSISTSDPISPPPTSGKINKMDEIIQKRAIAKHKWSIWQNEMNESFVSVSNYDESPSLTPAEKDQAWQLFISTYSINNPQETQDEEMRSKAHTRQKHWQGITLTSLHPPEKPAIISQAKDASSWSEPITGMEFVLLEDGCFLMGDNHGRGNMDEKPLHDVCLDSFYMGKHEVTNQQYRAFRKRHSSKEFNGKSLDQPKQPVVNVSWIDAVEFADWLSRKSGKKIRLATEAEWEYAARANRKSPRFWGYSAEDACEYANVHDKKSKEENSSRAPAHDCDDGYAISAPVGSFEANDFGLYDMIGNAFEWTQDWYGNSSYSGSPRKNPQGARGGSDRVVRGGSWNFGPNYCRSAARYRRWPDNKTIDIGFRLVIEK